MHPISYSGVQFSGFGKKKKKSAAQNTGDYGSLHSQPASIHSNHHAEQAKKRVDWGKVKDTAKEVGLGLLRGMSSTAPGGGVGPIPKK